MAKKLQIAKYWGAACGGCDVSLLDTNEFILDIAAVADIRFWPIAVDGKYSDLEAMDDGELDVSFFNGAVRNSENEHIAKLLRQKSKVMVAYGSCAHMGGIPGLANLATKDEIFDRAYLNNPSIEPGNTTVPQPRDARTAAASSRSRRSTSGSTSSTTSSTSTTTSPAVRRPRRRSRRSCWCWWRRSPGRPKRRPRAPSSAPREVAVCEDCPRKREEKKITKFYRPWQIIQDTERCLLEQGIPCAGIGHALRLRRALPQHQHAVPRLLRAAARTSIDQGAKFVSALGSIIDSKDPEEIEQILADIPDIAGYSYRFGLPASLLQRRIAP